MAIDAAVPLKLVLDLGASPLWTARGIALLLRPGSRMEALGGNLHGVSCAGPGPPGLDAAGIDA